MKVVVFSPHPDDAEILMGGTIAKYARRGHDVRIVYVTIPNQEPIREQEAKEAASILGATAAFLAVDPRQVAFDRRIVEVFDRVLEDYSPDIIYTSWNHDSHQDHVAVSMATFASSRKNLSSLYMYDQASPSGMTPAAFAAQRLVDISETMDLKMKAILAHRSQFIKYGQPWIDAIKGRASYWGFRINTQYAEAFEVVRDIHVI